MVHVWCMYGACMVHVWCMYESYMIHVCMVHVWFVYDSCMIRAWCMYGALHDSSHECICWPLRFVAMHNRRRPASNYSYGDIDRITYRYIHTQPYIALLQWYYIFGIYRISSLHFTLTLPLCNLLPLCTLLYFVLTITPHITRGRILFRTFIVRALK